MSFFVTDVLYNWISDFKISTTHVWRRNSFWEIVIKQSETFLAHWTLLTLTFDPVTQKSVGFLCFPGWMRGPSDEGRSRNTQVIDRKQFWHIWPRWPWPFTQWPYNTLQRHKNLTLSMIDCIWDLWVESPYSREDHWSGAILSPASMAICTIWESCSRLRASYVRNSSFSCISEDSSSRFVTWN